MGWKSAIGVTLTAMATHAADLKTVEKGAFSGIQDPLQVVVTNQTQWAQLWTKHTARKEPKEPPPEIDFQKQSVIVVTMGRKNTGGYALEITDVRRSGDKTEVIVTSREPKAGGFSIQALTAPFHMVQVPKIEGQVEFKNAENKKGG